MATIELEIAAKKSFDENHSIRERRKMLNQTKA
jgi:hypothetical protein